MEKRKKQYMIVHTVLLFSMAFMLGSCITQFIYFISNQGLLGSYGRQNPLLRRKRLSDWTEYEQRYVLKRLFNDLLLVGAFVVQHSLMACGCWKNLLYRFNISVSERLLYVIASCFTLTMMIEKWDSTPDVLLWGVDTGNSFLLWLFFFLLHTAAWIILFLQVAVMDPLELIGVKQVFYYYKNKDIPEDYMPKPLRLFYQHLRHAGPTCLCLTLWVHPVMTADRLLLALLFTFYMSLMHRVTLTDYKFACSYFAVQETTTTTTKRRVYRN